MRRASVGIRALPLNGIVVGLGFLLPWIAVAGVVLAVVWGGAPPGAVPPSRTRKLSRAYSAPDSDRSNRIGCRESWHPMVVHVSDSVAKSGHPLPTRKCPDHAVEAFSCW